MSKVSEILEGWRNHIIPPDHLKDLIQEVSKTRLDICTPCEFNSTKNRIKLFSRCTQCGCPLIQKSKSLQSSCPINKWSPITSPEEEQAIKSAINGEKDSSEGSSLETTDSN